MSVSSIVLRGRNDRMKKSGRIIDGCGRVSDRVRSIGC